MFNFCLSEPAEALSRTTIITQLDAKSRRGCNAMASATVAYGRSAFGWALRRGTVTVNPFRNVPVITTTRRERFPSDDELATIWRATDGAGPFNAIVRMLILTGQRRDEVGGMAWAELSDDLSTWTLTASRAKNGRAHIVPLSEPAQRLLRALPRSDALVFPGRRGAFNGFAKSKRALDAKSGVKEWRLHDLRRCCASWLQRLGVRLEVTEARLNHIGGTRGGLTGIYQRYDFAPEKRTALQAWGAHIEAIRSGQQLPANVARIRGAGGRQ